MRKILTKVNSERGRFGSQLGVILASAGSAVGLGNIWRFSTEVGKGGGAAFILVYLGFILLMAMPVMLCEFIIGRSAHANAIGAFQKLAPGKPWVAAGIMGVLGGFLVLSFYSVVAGWTLFYTIASASGWLQGETDYNLTFNTFVTNPWYPLIYLAAFLLLTHFVVSRGIERGIERYSKLLMPLLLVIILVLVGFSMTLPGAADGLRFLLKPDLSKVTPTELVLWSGSATYDLLGKAEITGPEADGSITVSYTLNGETLDTSVYNDLDLKLNYKDMGGAIDWSCVSLVQFDAHTAPTLSLDLGKWVEPGAYEPGYGVSCDLKLNDLLGGQAFITLQKLGSGGWETVADFGTLEYNASVEDDHGIVNFAYYDPELDALWGVDDVGRRYKAKFVISYIYPDGATGTMESPVFEQYGGGFAHYANSPAITYDAENKQLVAELVIDLSLVEPENVIVIAGSATREWSYIGTPTVSRVYTAGDGTLRWVFTVPLEEFSPGQYSFDVGLRYYNGTGPRWEQEVFTYNYIS